MLERLPEGQDPEINKSVDTRNGHYDNSVRCVVTCCKCVVACTQCRLWNGYNNYMCS